MSDQQYGLDEPDEEKKKMIDGDTIGAIIGLSVFSCFIGGAIWFAVWQGYYKEIDSYDYDKVNKWSKEFSDVNTMAKEMTWEDDLIDVSEFSKIRRLANKHLAEAIREGEEKIDPPEEIDSYDYQRVNGWAHEYPEIQLMVKEMTQNDDLIDKDEYKKIERAINKNWVQKARGEK